MTQGGQRPGPVSVGISVGRDPARAASIPPSARPSAEHVRALEAAGLLEVRLLKKFTQRPLMSVWKGEDKTGKLVFLTVVDACGTPDEERHVLGAARALVPLSGTPGIQNVYRVMEDVDAFVSEFLGQGTASDLVVLRWPMPQKIDFVCRVAAALAELHDADIVHGCLCPDNVLLDDDLHPVLTEVGMVSVKESLEGDPENFFGYGAYAAPEIALGKPDPRADVFSVGRLLSFVVLDRTPGVAEGAADGALSASSEASELEELRARNPSIAAIVRKCTAAPEARPATMKDLLAELLRCKQLLVPETGSPMRPSQLAPPQVPEKEVRPTRAPERMPTQRPHPLAKEEAVKSASPAWVSIASLLLLAGVIGAVLTLPIKSAAMHLALQAAVAIGAVGLTTGLRVNQGVRIVLAVAALGLAIGVNPIGRLSQLDSEDGQTRASAARSYVLGGGKDLHKNHLQLADLSNLDLTGADLAGADLSGANLARTKLAGAHVEGASFVGTDFSGANLQDVTLERAFAIGTATCDEATTLPAGWTCSESHKVRQGSAGR
jgi:serine/threonine protein kinase